MTSALSAGRYERDFVTEHETTAHTPREHKLMAATSADDAMAVYDEQEIMLYNYIVPLQNVGGTAIRADCERFVSHAKHAKGDFVSLTSANCEERQFPDLDRVDVTCTKQAESIAFGVGIHYCHGAPLARLEAKVVLAE